MCKTITLFRYSSSDCIFLKMRITCQSLFNLLECVMQMCLYHSLNKSDHMQVDPSKMHNICGSCGRLAEIKMLFRALAWHGLVDSIRMKSYLRSTLCATTD